MLRGGPPGVTRPEAGVSRWRRSQARRRQASEQNLRRPEGRNKLWHVGQADIVASVAGVVSATPSSLATQLVGPGPVRPHAVALAVDVEGHAAMQQTIQHGGGHHGVVEDAPPRPHAEVGGQGDGALRYLLATRRRRWSAAALGLRGSVFVGCSESSDQTLPH